MESDTTWMPAGLCLILLCLLWRGRKFTVPNRMGCFAFVLPLLVVYGARVLHLPHRGAWEAGFVSASVALFWLPLMWFYLRHSKDLKSLKCAAVGFGVFCILGA